MPRPRLSGPALRMPSLSMRRAACASPSPAGARIPSSHSAGTSWGFRPDIPGRRGLGRHPEDSHPPQPADRGARAPAPPCDLLLDA